jgi:hypothetical protein
MSEFEKPADDRRYRLPPELLRDAREADAELRRAIERVEGRYLVHRAVTVVRFGDQGGKVHLMTGSELLGFLTPFVHKETRDSAYRSPSNGNPDVVIRVKSTASTNIRRFVELYFDEIRRRICKGGPRNLSATTHAALVALANWLATHIGVYEKASTALAAAILISILSATKGAFCRMTTEEAKAALKKS